MFEYAAKRTSKSASITQLLDDLRQDLHYAARQLRRAPAFAALVIATLAIGIGANATMVGVIDRLLFRPPPEISDPGQLTRLVSTHVSETGEKTAGASVDYPLYLDYQRNIAGLSDVAGYTRPYSLPLVSNDPSAEAKVSLVTANFFQTLGVRPALGAFFSGRDGFPTTARMGGPAVAVISHAFWQRELGGRTDVIGAPIRVGKLSYNIVAVAPPAFRGIENVQPDVWVPITVALEVEFPFRVIYAHDGPYMAAFGRIAPRGSRQQIETQATAVYRALEVTQRSKTDRSQLSRIVAAPIAPARGPDAPREIRITLWLGGVSALVLLIVCANVANLLLGRAFIRRREIAVRLALGAGRGRLARQLLAESLLLSVLGGVFGIVLASVGGGLIQHLLVADVGASSFIDLKLLTFTALVALGTSIIVSLVPMLQSTTPDLSNGLRVTSTGAAGGSRLSARSVLLTVQAALCVILLVGAGLFGQSLRRLQQLDLGVDLDHTLQISLSGVLQLEMPRNDRLAIFDAIRNRVRSVQGVRSVAMASDIFRGGRAVSIYPLGQPNWVLGPYNSIDGVTYEVPVDSGMFRTLGTRSLRGRDFNSGDIKGARRVTILNEPMAKQLFPGKDALGQCVVLPRSSYERSDECVEVVGILSGFLRMSLVARGARIAYTPFAQDRFRNEPFLLFVSTAGAATAAIEEVRNAVLAVRPDLRKLDIKSMRQDIEPEMRPWNLAANMFMMFAGVALIIATIGLYAVVSSSVAQRTTEIAIRLALGARTHHISGVVSAGSLYAVTAGLGIGMIVAFLVRNSIGAMLFQTSPSDPYVIGGVALLLFGVAVVAMTVPLMRALRVNPSEVMRQT